MEICWGREGKVLNHKFVPGPGGYTYGRTARPVAYNSRRDYISHGPVTGQPELTGRRTSK